MKNMERSMTQAEFHIGEGSLSFKIERIDGPQVPNHLLLMAAISALLKELDNRAPNQAAHMLIGAAEHAIGLLLEGSGAGMAIKNKLED